MSVEIDHFERYGKNSKLFDSHRVIGGSSYRTDFIYSFPLVVFCSFDNIGSVLFVPTENESYLNVLSGIAYESYRDQIGHKVDLRDGMISLEENQQFSLRLYRNYRKPEEGFAKEIIISVVP